MTRSSAIGSPVQRPSGPIAAGAAAGAAPSRAIAGQRAQSRRRDMGRASRTPHRRARAVACPAGSVQPAVVEAPRIAPGSRAEIGAVNALLASAIGRVAGTTEPPRLFTTLARHRRLFRRWLRFAGALMPGGTLPRADTELLVLRVAHNTGCDYEWSHHERLGRQAGLSPAEVERVREGPSADGWSERRRTLLRAADELHADRFVSDETWG